MDEALRLVAALSGFLIGVLFDVLGCSADLFSELLIDDPLRRLTLVVKLPVPVPDNHRESSGQAVRRIDYPCSASPDGRCCGERAS